MLLLSPDLFTYLMHLINPTQAAAESSHSIVRPPLCFIADKYCFPCRPLPESASLVFCVHRTLFQTDVKLFENSIYAFSFFL